MNPRESALPRPVAMGLAARRPASITLDELLNAEVPY